MPQDLLWVHKDAQSKRLSQSEKLEEALIRRHVQQPGRPHATWKQSTSRSNNNPRAQRKSRDSKERSTRGDRSIPRSISPQTVVLTPAERRSFGYFMHCAGGDYWAGWRDAYFWQQLVPQIAQSSAPVMHGLLALSTFHENAVGAAQSAEVAARQSHLMQIAKAVSSARKLGGDANLIQHLMTSIVLCCVLQLDRHREAVGFLRAATLMLQQSTSQLPSDEVDIIENSLRPGVGLLCNSFCRTPEASTAFMLSVQRHRLSASVDEPPIPRIPTSFQRLGEAAHCLGRMLKWAHDTVPIGRQPGVWPTFRELRRSWLKALDATSIDATHRGSINSRKLLRLASIYGLIIIETFNSIEVTIYDQYHAQFVEILDLATEVCALPNACAWMFAKRVASLGGVDNGLISMLSFVGAKSRDTVVRQRVLDLLYSSRRVEGNRLASVTADGLKTIWRLDIRNLDDVQTMHYLEQNRRKVCVRVCERRARA